MQTLKKVGYGVLGVQLVVSIVLVVLAMSTHFIKLLYGVLGSVLLLGIIVGLFFMIKKESKKLRITAIVISGVFIILFGILSYYLYVTNKALDDVTGASTEVDEINVYVGKDDAVASINEAVNSEYLFALVGTDDQEHIKETVDKISTDVGVEVKTQEFESIFAAIGGFEAGQVQGIITSEGTINALDASEDFEDYSINKLKVIMETEIEEVIEQVEEEVDIDRFCVYFSGIDTYGTVAAKSRSDVNIIAVVNNKTKTVLLLSTPRDYYVKLASSTKRLKNTESKTKSELEKNSGVEGKEDKLTHAGLYGIECSMGTLENVYDVDINYFVRINFSGFEKIIDKLGGVDVYSQYGFTFKTSEGDYVYQEGENHLMGREALLFARNRHAFVDGDRQRGRNQMQVIKATIEKLQSSSMIKNYAGLMDELSDTFQTNLSKEDIGYLVQSTLDDGQWKVLTYSVSGSDATKTCYSLGTSAYVMTPNEGDVKYGNELISRVLNDEDVNQEEIDEYIVNKDEEDLITEEATTEEEETTER